MKDMKLIMESWRQYEGHDHEAPGGHLVSRAWEKIWDLLPPGVQEKLIIHTKETPEIEGKALKPMARKVMLHPTAPVFESKQYANYNMPKMKKIMEAFRMSTLPLIRENLSREDLVFFLEDTPYKDPLPPFIQKGITNQQAGDASRDLFVKHLQDGASAGKGIPGSLDELEDAYYDYYDWWTRQLDPDDTSHLDDL